MEKLRRASAGIMAITFGASLAGWTAVVDLPDPGHTLTRLQPADAFAPQISGMALLDRDHMLVSTYAKNMGGYPDTNGALYLVAGLRRADKIVTYRKVAKGLKDVMGLAIVDGQVYACDRDRVFSFVDADKDGVYETTRTLAPFPHYDGWYEYTFGPVYRDGKFYIGLAAEVQHGGLPLRQRGEGRSTLMEVGLDGKTKVVASGFRAPNGIGLGPKGSLLMTDNQGGWTPASKLNVVMPGKFYGYMLDPPSVFQTQPVTPPAAWIPYGEVAESPTEPLMLKSGTFAGQVVFGDIRRNFLLRAFLEEVNGNFQACVMGFSGGYLGSVNRLAMDTVDGTLYAGLLSYERTHTYSLQALKPNGAQKFEMLAVRSRQEGMEVEFTMPADAASIKPSDVLIRSWGYIATADYGGPKQNLVTLPAKSLRWSPDSRRLLVSIDGLVAGKVVQITLNAIKTPAGDTLFNRDAWYTLNAISPTSGFSTALAPPGIGGGDSPAREGGADFGIARAAGGGWRLHRQGRGAYRLSILDLGGRLLRAERGEGDIELRWNSPGPGVYLLRWEQDGRVGRIMLPAGLAGL